MHIGSVQAKQDHGKPSHRENEAIGESCGVGGSGKELIMERSGLF